MRAKFKNINKILCLTAAFLTVFVLLITAWAQTDIVTNTILSFEREDIEKEVTMVNGSSEPDLPHTLRAVIELAELQPEIPAGFPAEMPHASQQSGSVLSDENQSSADAEQKNSLELEETPVDSVETSPEDEKLSANRSEVFADEEITSAAAEDLSAETKVQGDFVSVPSAGFLAGPEKSKQQPNFVPAEPNELYGYETANGNIYTYTGSKEISYRVYGSLYGSGLAWFACDKNGNIFGIIREVPVTWVCSDYDKNTPGAYHFTAEFEGYNYEGAPVSATVNVMTDEPAPAKSIGGNLWLDENADGIMDKSETGIANYPVSLYAVGDTGTVVQATKTQRNGTYRFENLKPGSYLVGIASETIKETDYLIPMVGIVGDNRFKLVELDEERLVAFSDIITISQEMDTAVENLHAGMRLPVRKQPLMGEITVSDAKSFIQAVNDDSTWKITLDADIVIEYGMTNDYGNWNTLYQNTAQPGYFGQPQGILVGNKSNAIGNGSFVINGQGHKIVFNWPHTIVEGGNFNFLNTGYVKSFTMQNLTWYGSSEVGCYFPAINVTRDVQIIFDHVTYKGPGMGDIAIFPVYNPQVRFVNCDITMSYRNASGGSGVDSDGYGGDLPALGSAPNGTAWQDTHASEAIAANFITFEGSNTITKQDSPADAGSFYGDIDPILYIYWSGNGYVKIADGASLMIYDEAGKTKHSAYTTGLIGAHLAADTQLDVGENAALEYHHVGGGNGFITDFYKLSNFTIGKNARVVFDIKTDAKYVTNDVSNYAAYFTADTVQVGEGANWTYVADYAGSAASADNSMISANTISVAEDASVNIIAKNNSKADTLITLRDSSSGISFTDPQNVLLFNSKSDANTYVIKNSFGTANFDIKTNTIRSWLLEGGASMAGTVAFGNQTALIGNYITAPNPHYQWALNNMQYSASLRSGANAEITNYPQGYEDIFNLSGTRTLKNINVLELQAETSPMNFIFYKENESSQALAGVKFELYPRDSAGTGWNISAAMQATSAADGKVQFAGLGTGEYLLAEVETAAGYMLPAGRWKVTVNAAAKSIAILPVPDSNGVFPPAFITEGGIQKLPNYRIQQTAITVSKIVSSNYIDFKKSFTFKIRFWNVDDKPFMSGTQFEYTGGIIPDSGAAAPLGGTLTLDSSGQATFTLKHGQMITFSEIPVNSRIQVIEITDTNYVPSFKDSEAMDAESSADTGIRVLTGDRTFAFTNTRLALVPTGISTGTQDREFLVLSMLLLAGALSAAKLYCKRKEMK